MLKRNLIVGGLGLFGRYLARRLIEGGEAVALFDREDHLPPGFEDLKGKIEIMSGDISMLSHVMEAVKKSNPECIFHVAALMNAPCENSPALGFHVNIQGMFHVLEAARLFGVRQVLFPSSRATFGADTPAVVTADIPQKPTVMYGVTKVCGELLGEYYGRRYGFDFRGLRFPVVVGAGRLVTTPLIADVNKIIEAAVSGQPFTSGLDPSYPPQHHLCQRSDRGFPAVTKCRRRSAEPKNVQHNRAQPHSQPDGRGVEKGSAPNGG